MLSNFLRLAKNKRGHKHAIRSYLLEYAISIVLEH